MTIVEKRKERRRVMRKFGLYLDWLEFCDKVKRGEENPPDGYDLGRMMRSAKRLEVEYEDAVNHYIAIG